MDNRIFPYPVNTYIYLTIYWFIGMIVLEGNNICVIIFIKKLIVNG